jgi:hypothetical protein
MSEQWLWKNRSAALDHGLVVPGGEEEVYARVWDVATKRGQWPFVALYTSRGNESRKGLWFDDDLWRASYEPPTGPARNVTPVPDHLRYDEEVGRYQPLYREQFLKMCRSAMGLTLIVPSTWTDEEALSLLRSASSLWSDLEERFFNRRRRESAWRFRDRLRPISPKNEWACILFCFDSIPVTVFLSDERIDIDLLLAVAHEDKRRCENW